MWPIHDLVVTEFMAWILPTHMKSHLIRFAVGLGALWLCLKQAETSLANATFLLAYGSLVAVMSVVWIYWYHRSVLFALGKPWMNPQVPAINRLEKHVPLRLFDSIDKARRAACLPHMVA